MARRSGIFGQRGVSLVEALVAMAVMGFGMLAIVGVQSTLRFNADISKQRAEATRLVEQELEFVRAFRSVGSGNPTEDEFDAIATTAMTSISGTDLNATYERTRTVLDSTDDSGRVISKTIHILVQWEDRTGETRSISMQDVITRVDPMLSGFVKAERPLTGIGRRGGRHPTIPGAATDLTGDNSRSVFLPPNPSPIGWIFDNATGAITHECANVSNVNTLALSDCTALAISAQLVSGRIRFNLRGATHNLGAVSVLKPAIGADAAWVIDHATSRLVRICPVPMTTEASALTIGDVTSGCTSASSPVTVTPFLPTDTTPLSPADSEDPRWPTLPATVDFDWSWTNRTGVNPGNFNCYSDHQTSTLAHVTAASPRTWIDYFCIVKAYSAGGWGGRTKVVPLTLTDPYSGTTGATWTLGSNTGEYKVCRYTQVQEDYTDNDDHPAVYSVDSATCTSNCRLVKGNLVNQNFLVIAGSKSCPEETTAVDPASGNLVNSNTRQHQP